MSQEQRISILIIDDTAANLKYLQEVLQSNKYDVQAAPNGRLGLQAALSEPPDLILLDILMPGMNGYEVCSQLKAQEATHNIPVIFLSALDETWDKVKAFELGAVDYVTKPFEPVELLQRIKAQLQLSTAQQQLTELNDTLKQQMKIVDRYVPTLSADTNGRITRVSEAYCKLCGYSKDELIGESCAITHDPDFSQTLCREVLDAINQGQSWKGESRGLKKDGCRYWVHINATPEYSEDGTITGHTCIEQDITDHKHVERLSITDELTGLYNRRKFNVDIAKELNCAERDKKNLALLMLDIDHFKLYNDTYGHHEGDKVLHAIGQTLQQTFLRAGDLSFRLGGEEFGVILSCKKTADFISMAEQVRANIEALGIPHADNTVAPVVTTSIGIAIVSEGDSKSPIALYRAADEALYQAKQAGRNRVEIA
jgi:diguanylate cyclase (GGDEF)-like protein/PAS domain S-box-containing protein